VTDILLKFKGHFYRPDGSKIESVRAVYRETMGPIVAWTCSKKEETVARVEIMEDDGNDGNPVLVGEKIIDKVFEKHDTLIVPLVMDRDKLGK